MVVVIGVVVVEAAVMEACVLTVEESVEAATENVVTAGEEVFGATAEAFGEAVTEAVTAAAVEVIGAAVVKLTAFVEIFASTAVEFFASALLEALATTSVEFFASALVEFFSSAFVDARATAPSKVVVGVVPKVAAAVVEATFFSSEPSSSPDRGSGLVRRWFTFFASELTSLVVVVDRVVLVLVFRFLMMVLVLVVVCVVDTDVVAIVLVGFIDTLLRHRGVVEIVVGASSCEVEICGAFNRSSRNLSVKPTPSVAIFAASISSTEVSLSSVENDLPMLPWPPTSLRACNCKS